MDLLSYFSNHSHLIVVQIERAANKDQLKKASQNLTTMIQTLNAKGVKIRYITQLVNELNRKVFEKLYHFVAPPELINNSCLLVMGSEGRGEQILKTDQDNAIILRDGLLFPDLEKISKELTETLMSFGYPACAGNIMVSNPYWSKSLKAFQEEIYQWVHYPTHESMMNLAIFFDATATCGDNSLLIAVKEYLFSMLQDNKPFYSIFAKPTVAFETPLGIFANFIVDKSHHNQLDIKKGGIFPIVHGVRSLALEHRLNKTNTIERIKELVELNVFDKKFGIELIEAFAFMLSLRLQSELSKAGLDQPHDNYINPSKLNKLERDLLKDSLKIVNEFKKFITYHFKLNMVS
jgi:CBS domain-containing protein